MADDGVLRPGDTDKKYEMRISRLTVDKLGVKLYDRVSAVVAELVANGYDADAEHVTVELPLASALARTREDGSEEDYGYEIVVADDGHGMSPDEAVKHYLRVGRDRRADHEQGPTSRNKLRTVLGRKGIGKLAPFGICRTIEVISSGGDPTAEGYLTSHFVMDFDEILQDYDDPVEFAPGNLDRTYATKHGTRIILRDFKPKRVPDTETFKRQLERRFCLANTDFEIDVKDLRDVDAPVWRVEAFKIPIMDGTKLDLADRPVLLDDGKSFQVTGWLGFAQSAYKNEEMSGVRIYARGKIVATTRDFEQPAGFTGEYRVRSYLVGEVHAEWLDEDDGEDLVRTDRQDILWDSDLGMALRKWGGELIREIGAMSREPRRKRVRQIFLERSDIAARARERFTDESVVESALDLAEQIGGLAAEDELGDDDYVNDLCEVILSVAPHRALIEAFQDFSRLAGTGDATIQQLSDLFGKARVAEVASYGQVAAERVRGIVELERTIYDEATDEAALQRILTDAPWLIHPMWTVITANQSLKTFKTAFEKYCKKETGKDVTLAITYEGKRPDFILVNVDGRLHIVEVKVPGYDFADADFDRLINYVEAFEAFFKEHPGLAADFSRGWQIDLIADGVKISDVAKRRAFEALAKEPKVVVRKRWVDLLNEAKKVNEAFLEVRDASARRTAEVESSGARR
jgi:hypothetical protein